MNHDSRDPVCRLQANFVTKRSQDFSNLSRLPPLAFSVAVAYGNTSSDDDDAIVSTVVYEDASFERTEIN